MQSVKSIQRDVQVVPFRDVLVVVSLCIAFSLASIQLPAISLIFLVLSIVLNGVVRKVMAPRYGWLILLLIAFLAVARFVLGGDSMYSMAIFGALCLSLYFGFVISASFKSRRLVIIALMIQLVVFVVFVVGQVIIGADLNSILPSGSRNAVTGIVWMLLLPLLYVYRDERFVVFVLSVTAAIFMCLVGGRSSLFAVLVFMVVSLFGLRGTVWALFALIFFVILLHLDQSFFSGLIASQRWRIWSEYVSCLGFGEIVMGVPKACLMGGVVEYYDYNLHNSFLAFHYKVGLVALVPFLFLLWGLRNGAVLRCRVTVAVLLVLFVKLFFDSLAFPGGFDFLIFYILFDVSDRAHFMRAQY